MARASIVDGSARISPIVSFRVVSLAILAVAFLGAGSAPAIQLDDELTIVSVLDAAGGSIVPVPVYVRDRSGTPIGGDSPPGRTIQGLSISVAYSPAVMVQSIVFERAGVAVAASPFLERSVAGVGVYSWFAMFDELDDPLVLSSDAPVPGDLIGHLLVSLPALPPGSQIELDLLEEYSSLANRSGSIVERTGRRLTLTSGLLGVGVLLFEDGFETGTTGAWSNSTP